MVSYQMVGNCYMPGEERKINQFFIDEKQYKVVAGIALNKIKTFINYQLHNGDVASWIRQAANKTWNYYKVGLKPLTGLI